jgi:hypothetical protein
MEGHYVSWPMGPWTRVVLENQSYIQVHTDCFRCTLDEKTESRFPICPRNRIYHEGTLLPVGELSTIDGVVSICIPSSVDSMHPHSFRCHKLNYVAFEPGAHLHEITSESFYSSDVRSLCIPASVRSFVDGVSGFPETLEAVTFESIGSPFWTRNITRQCLGTGTFTSSAAGICTSP